MQTNYHQMNVIVQIAEVIMNNKPKSYLMIILGFLFLLAAGIVADTTNLYWTSFACLVISIINLFFGFGILIGAPIIE